MKKSFYLQAIVLMFMISWSGCNSQIETEQQKQLIQAKDSSLVVVWTSGDREVALKMVFMYTYNAQKQGWWDEITLLVWGPSSKLLSEDKELQEKVKEMQKEGVHLLACKGCADLYGVSEKLEEIGVTVRYTGKDLTEFIKERHVITF